MSTLSSGNAEQYADSRKLAARARLNSEYTLAETPWFEWIAAQLPVEPGARLLDIGCGPAWFWAATGPSFPAGLRLTLADLSAGMVTEAIDRCQTLELDELEGCEADAAALPFEDASFDGVIAMHMLYHVADPAVAIAECYRVLRPGGFLAVTTNGANNMREVYELTTKLGGAPSEPVAAIFGFEAAERLLRAQFGAVVKAVHPARLRVTEPEDLILAMTSYPPGDRASSSQMEAFRDAVASAFAAGGGVLESRKESGLFLCRKAD